MRFTMRGVAAAALLGLLAAFAGAEDKEEKKDKGKSDKIDDATFVTKAGSGNMAEMKAGELGQKQSENKDVRAFAAKLVKDHANAQNDLQEAAKAAGVKMPKELEPEHKKGGEMLAEHKGKKDFDEVFVKHMVESHAKSVELYEKASKSVKSDELKKYIEKTLPVVKEHLEMAEKMAKGGKDKKDRKKED